MKTVNLRSFRQIVRHNKRRIRIFLSRLKRKTPRGLDSIIKAADQSIWKKLDCLDCANCCKTMSPTYTTADIARISRHLDMTEKSFKKKWLYKDNNGDWLNVQLPCQFLDANSNKCSIYEVRPKDCAGFPHHTKKRMVDYMHVYKQNIEYCPATYRVVKKMMAQMDAEVHSFK
ncbi:MAG TPA: YkgJ family cysteine cluster protein [Puia sp.]|nr:YkgJ family cysteine cluster protein [Puia sp.]